MIRITKLTEYAMLILSHMAKESGSTLSATYLAEMLNLTAPTVSKILKLLAEAGFVQSVRGSDGGYHLAVEPEKISVAAVIGAMEGELAMTECCNDMSLCEMATFCTMRDNWRKINGLVKKLLDGYSVIDITRPGCDVK